ncbi:hypothetical protein P8452_29852 [Trifolium repens]|nr:hypothetical protein P8452_29852 [Trifolium repens]
MLVKDKKNSSLILLGLGLSRSSPTLRPHVHKDMIVTPSILPSEQYLRLENGRSQVRNIGHITQIANNLIRLAHNQSHIPARLQEHGGVERDDE